MVRSHRSQELVQRRNSCMIQPLWPFHQSLWHRCVFIVMLSLLTAQRDVGVCKIFGISGEYFQKEITFWRVKYCNSKRTKPKMVNTSMQSAQNKPRVRRRCPSHRVRSENWSQKTGDTTAMSTQDGNESNGWQYITYDLIDNGFFCQGKLDLLS